jgi:hypothetical protein
VVGVCEGTWVDEGVFVPAVGTLGFGVLVGVGASVVATVPVVAAVAVGVRVGARVAGAVGPVTRPNEYNPERLPWSSALTMATNIDRLAKASSTMVIAPPRRPLVSSFASRKT